MVKSGLKVGDTFVENGCEYVVLSVNADNSYVSQMVEHKDAEKPKRARKQVDRVK